MPVTQQPATPPGAFLVDSRADANEIDDHTRNDRLLSSTVARERHAAAEAGIALAAAATAAADFARCAKVKRVYVNNYLCKVEHIATTPSTPILMQAMRHINCYGSLQPLSITCCRSAIKRV